ncbi:MAG: 4-(cytidine 5'-diphospho)-2-C-methyl-D-erythritol kinase [Gemmatimonadota bacterium]
MSTSALPAPAKLNLRLVVLARERSGYHQIETIFCALALADEVAVDVEGAASGIELQVDGPAPAPTRENLAYRAASAFFEAVGRPPRARIRLRKRIPAGAGLGGGSSDAAATLMSLQRLHGDPLDPNALLGLGARLGSDVPYFLANSPLAIAWGRGQRLLALPPLPTAAVLLAVPDATVSTPDAYRALDERRAGDERGAAAPPLLLLPGGLRTWETVADVARNDFEPIIFERIPVLGRIRAALDEAGAAIARLTGTGSVVYGVFDGRAERDAAAAALASRFEGVRLITTETAGVRIE